MSKFGRKQSSYPGGWDYVEPTLTALENELRDKVNEPHEGMRRVESNWPVHQINWQKSRYIYDLYYTYHRISREIYNYCVENKLVDAALIAKWKKPGYERLCSTTAINPQNSKFGTVSICRVPRSALEGQTIENQTTGCRGCASGPTTRNIFDNKYGQYLAQIQIAREEKEKEKERAQEAVHSDRHPGNGSSIREASASSVGRQQQQQSRGQVEVVGAADGGAGEHASRARIWAADDAEERAAADIAGVGVGAEAGSEEVPSRRPTAAAAGAGGAGGGGAAASSEKDDGAHGATASASAPTKEKYQPPGKRSRTK